MNRHDAEELFELLISEAKEKLNLDIKKRSEFNTYLGHWEIKILCYPYMKSNVLEDKLDELDCIKNNKEVDCGVLLYGGTATIGKYNLITGRFTLSFGVGR